MSYIKPTAGELYAAEAGLDFVPYTAAVWIPNDRHASGVVLTDALDDNGNDEEIAYLGITRAAARGLTDGVVRLVDWLEVIE